MHATADERQCGPVLRDLSSKNIFTRIVQNIPRRACTRQRAGSNCACYNLLSRCICGVYETSGGDGGCRQSDLRTAIRSRAWLQSEQRFGGAVHQGSGVGLCSRSRSCFRSRRSSLRARIHQRKRSTSSSGYFALSDGSSLQTVRESRAPGQDASRLRGSFIDFTETRRRPCG